MDCVDLPRIIKTPNGGYASVNVVGVESLLYAAFPSASSRFHIKKLSSAEFGGDVSRWIREAGSEGYSRIRLGFVKKIGREDVLDADLTAVATSSAVVRPPEQKKDALKGEDAVVAAAAAGIVNGFNLFGAFLPARRCRDTCTLYILPHEDKPLPSKNYYVQDTNEMVFGDYKTVDRYGVQRFVLDATTLPFVPTEKLAAAVGFLRDRDPGWLIEHASYRDPNNFPSAQREKVGFVSNDARRWWSRLVFSQGDNAAYLKLCEWMAHSPGTNVTTYSEKAKPPPLPQELDRGCESEQCLRD